MNRNKILVVIVPASLMMFIFSIHVITNITFKLNRFIHDYNDTCEDFLLKHRGVFIDEALLGRMTEKCFKMGKSRKDSIFSKMDFKRVFENIACKNKELKFPNMSESFTALASFPGSGNTWMRLLLESITGLYTGSIYRDVYFTGSRYCPSDIGALFVKTHKTSDSTLRADCPVIQFSRAIFILRNPYEAMIAQFNRINSGKIGFAGQTAFSSRQWEQFVHGSSQKWRKMALYWMTEFDRPVYVVVYENLQPNIMLEMYRIMTFVNFKVTLQDLYCLANLKSDMFYRASKPDWLTKTKLFNNEMKEKVNSEIKRVQSGVLKVWQDDKVLESYIL